MYVIFLLGFPALLFCNIAQGIVCKVCDSGNDKGCYQKEETCKTHTGKCYTQASYMDGVLYYMSYGCIYFDYEAWYCGTKGKDEHYIHVENCCTTDKCNGEVPSLPQNWN